MEGRTAPGLPSLSASPENFRARTFSGGRSEIWSPGDRPHTIFRAGTPMISRALRTHPKFFGPKDIFKYQFYKKMKFLLDLFPTFFQKSTFP